MSTTLHVARDIALDGPQAEPLPARRGNMAAAAIDTCQRSNIWGKEVAGMTMQAVSAPDSLDLRAYETHEYVDAVYEQGILVRKGGTVEVPRDRQKPVGRASGMFLNTVHACFADHYPLGIRPDALMWMVLHEVGVCVKRHPEHYRNLFTDADGKKLISVRVDELDIHDLHQPEAWAAGIARLHAGLRRAMPPGLIDHLLPELSTHDLESTTASMVAVLDAASPYYDYRMRTDCGIPRIRLFGEGADYDRILAACAQLAEQFHAHLGDYFTHLLPVLKEIADTACGRKQPDPDFWSSIYKHYGGSGTDDMDGWVTTFVNYVGAQREPKDPALYDWRENLKRNKGRWGKGIYRADAPAHISAVPFVWSYRKDHSRNTQGAFAGRNFAEENGGNGVNFDCRLVGGFLAVDDIDGFATPRLGYAVLRGGEIKTDVNDDGTWTAHPDGRDPVKATRE